MCCSDQGRFCSYHVQAAYKRLSAKRSELQSGLVSFKTFSVILFQLVLNLIFYEDLIFCDDTYVCIETQVCMLGCIHCSSP